ncbi:hypothetical protein T4A_12096 [Trichinella pseudospiralis]|uniref:Uncharacterized protein n=1 Tax=Trichinella pseudospiralis TaxID=6337 RepID=A0A0V1DPT4_TRIPS|nr:hypothetical protein T4A_12096 [Trichinella pseudospiralis]
MTLELQIRDQHYNDSNGQSSNTNNENKTELTQLTTDAVSIVRPR